LAQIIDTSVAIHLRDGDPFVRAQLDVLNDEVLLSIISQVELEGGVYADPTQSVARRARLDLMLTAVPVLPFNRDAAAAYGAIVSALGYSRRKVLDRMIAAQAIVHQATLVTFNGDDFRDIPGLRLLEWRRP
jgi:predicted nucleic acid-binding protein